MNEKKWLELNINDLTLDNIKEYSKLYNKDIIIKDKWSYGVAVQIIKNRYIELKDVKEDIKEDIKLKKNIKSAADIETKDNDIIEPLENEIEL